ncbi:MAG: sialate O-acetylesterase [Paludibacter sp.]|nr:sialate O-acetylesterase [Paludibacter sp.]
MNNLKRNNILLLLLIFTGSIFANIRLPKLISNGMVLQCDSKVKIWGWADSLEKIAITIDGKNYKTTSTENGDWQLTLVPHKAGGPFSMIIEGNNRLEIKDILFGEVWLCSGQSNMELPMRRVKPLYEDEIKQANNQLIRYFEVPKKYNFKNPEKDYLSGNWQSVNPLSILDFSAVSYFFGTALFQKYHVPIGLINASLGGSPIEAWMSEDALKEFPNQLNEAYKFRNDDLIKQIESSDKARINTWYKTSVDKDEGEKNGYSQPGFDDSNCLSMKIPGYWANTTLGNINGVVWFRREFEVSQEDSGKPASLNLGRIVDADSVFINGKFIGNITYQYPPRRYKVPQGVLLAGKNIIVARIVNNSGKGGFVLDKPYELKVGNHVVDLKSDWKMKPGCTMPPLEGETFIRWKPMGLYNAMIAPLLNYAIKGTIWYQGESNTGKPDEYAKLFPALILGWRKNFEQGDFPFLFVQLPNFMESKSQPSESNWAETRESQLKTLSVPNTAMVVTIDIGEWNDIHPLDKQDVGNRLALAARKLAYNDSKVVYSGPLYKSMKVTDRKIELTFSQIGSGLEAKGQIELNGFAIAGADRKFVWAKAEIKNNKVIVWNNEVQSPVLVRYAWADNPDGANLFNKDGLPASPFTAELK